MQNSFKDTWLHSPVDPLHSEDALKQIIGQFIVEAMLHIESDKRKRIEILHSTESDMSAKITALNGGIWYPGEYFSHIKPYQTHASFSERFQFLQKSGGFLHGCISGKNWRQLDYDVFPSGKQCTFHWKIESKDSPAETLVNILDGQTFCLFDCSTIVSLVHYLALIRVLGKERFDRCFSGQFPFSLPCILSNYATMNPLYLFIEGVKTKDLNDIILGDKAGFKSHPAYSYKHPYGTALYWNVFCTKAGATTNFVGFGLGDRPLTQEEVIQKLVQEYNVETNYDPEIISGERTKIVDHYFKSAQQKFSEKKLNNTITMKTLSDDNLGLIDEFLRLSAKKILRLLQMPLDNCSLREAFTQTTPNARAYAMDQKTRAVWSSRPLLPVNPKRDQNLPVSSAFGKKQ